MRYEFISTTQMKAYATARVLNGQGKVVEINKPAGKLVVSYVGNTKFGIISNRCW